MLKSGATNALGHQLGADVVNQRANRCKCVAVNVIVINNQPEMIFQPGNKRNNGHGIQFWNGTQQRRFEGKRAAAPIQAQHFIEQTDDFLCYLQLRLPEWLWLYGDYLDTSLVGLIKLD